MVSRFATASIHLTTIQTLLSVKCPHFDVSRNGHNVQSNVLSLTRVTKPIA